MRGWSGRGSRVVRLLPLFSKACKQSWTSWKLRERESERSPNRDLGVSSEGEATLLHSRRLLSLVEDRNTTEESVHKKSRRRRRDERRNGLTTVDSERRIAMLRCERFITGKCNDALDERGRDGR
jgi:hypothetical protein